jgi:signal transduction histidine kinase
MLLFLARADAEACLPDLESVNLDRFLAEHLTSWANHARGRDIRFELKTAENCSVRAQPALLRELVDNLIDNACKYSAPGTPITVSLFREPGQCSCSVKDNGVGINSVDLPHVFEPFYRSAITRQRGIPGVGLGLAVVERIARALGGKISLESSPGQSSCFTLSLPALKDTTRSNGEAWESCADSTGALPQSAPLPVSDNEREVTEVLE